MGLSRCVVQELVWEEEPGQEGEVCCVRAGESECKELREAWVEAEAA